MKLFRAFAGWSLPVLALAVLWCSPAAAQDPGVITPIIVDTAGADHRERG